VNSTGYIHVTEFLNNRMQIFKMKILTGPIAPTLNPILPAISTNGSINLTWSEPLLANNYTVYRHNTQITGGNLWAATVIVNEIDALTYVDTWQIEGNWWYGVVAHNDSGDSPVSNSQMVSIDLPSPLPPSLDPILPSTSINGSINLTWSKPLLADNYTVYRYPVEITNLNVGSATKIATKINALTYLDTWYVEGLWWYAVIAHNETGDSLVSNSRNVTIELPNATAPILAAITPNPSTTGSIELHWNADPLVVNYTVLRANVEITPSNLNQAQTIKSNLTSNTYTDILSHEEIYWYGILAFNNTGRSIISNSVMVNYSIPSTVNPVNPLNHTNGIWQDVKEGLHTINLTDETGVLRLELIVSLKTATRIKLTYSTTNFSQNQLENAREYWYIEVEYPNYVNQNESNIKFYYSKTNLSTEARGNLQILKFKNNAWSEVEISWNHDLGYGLVSYSEIQYYALRVDSSSSDAQSFYTINSYVLEWFVVFTAIAVINRIMKTKKLRI
jgi:hypothetical protein